MLLITLRAPNTNLGVGRLDFNVNERQVQEATEENSFVETWLTMQNVKKVSYQRKHLQPQTQE